jgi:hypothetical protein
VVLFTEREGEEPDVLPDRVPQFFGRTREELLDRLGTVVRMPNRGHNAPLLEAELSVPLIKRFLEAPPCGD